MTQGREASEEEIRAVEAEQREDQRPTTSIEVIWAAQSDPKKMTALTERWAQQLASIGVPFGVLGAKAVEGPQ